MRLKTKSPTDFSYGANEILFAGANHNVGSLDDGIDFLADFELFAFDSKKKIRGVIH